MVTEGRVGGYAVTVATLLAAAAACLTAVACQDGGSGPEHWTVTEVHAAVGLEAGHRVLACSDCHRAGERTPPDPACAACHLDDHAATREPDHQALGYGTSCADCHSSAGWRPASFDHDALGFPLEGAHRRVSCAGCHGAPPYGSVARDCWACHEADYQEAIPDHVALGFSRSCQDCHTAAAWIPAAFDHEPLFPLARGAHQRYQRSCSSCHPDPRDYAAFTCTDCHDGAHSQRSMDREHDDVASYRYASTACLTCHPRGSEHDAGDDD